MISLKEIDEIYERNSSLDFCRVCANYGDPCSGCKDKKDILDTLNSELTILLRRDNISSKLSNLDIVRKETFINYLTNKGVKVGS